MQTCSLPALPVLLGKTFFFSPNTFSYLVVVVVVVARGNVNFSRFFFTARRDWATRRVGAARLHLRKGDAGDRAAFGSMCRSCQAGRPCRAEWAGGQGRAGWLLPLLLTACSPQHPSLGPCSCSGGPVSPEASLPRWRRGTSHCVPSPLPVPPYRLPWGLVGAP